jgi:ribosomal protein S18 acetylase RimI-like enzyme
VITLRTATLDDTTSLLALWEVAAENDSRPRDTSESVTRLLDRDAEACIVAVDDAGRIVGSLIAGWDGWRAHLYRLAVHPDIRRQGVATELLRRAEARLRALGATRIDAMVLDANGLGQALWTGSGYTRQEEWRRWVRPMPPR